MIWPRDLVEVAGGLLAAGARDDARRTLGYLQATQEADGHWPQNMWVGGETYWFSIQMGETTLPVLLADLLHRDGGLGEEEFERLCPMIRRAVVYRLLHGPSSQEDRWENERGFTPFTLAAMIAALLAAADLADRCAEPSSAAFLRKTADAWNDDIEFCTYVEDTELARRVGGRSRPASSCGSRSASPPPSNGSTTEAPASRRSGPGTRGSGSIMPTCPPTDSRAAARSGSRFRGAGEVGRIRGIAGRSGYPSSWSESRRRPAPHGRCSACADNSPDDVAEAPLGEVRHEVGLAQEPDEPAPGIDDQEPADALAAEAVEDNVEARLGLGGDRVPRHDGPDRRAGQLALGEGEDGVAVGDATSRSS